MEEVEDIIPETIPEEEFPEEVEIIPGSIPEPPSVKAGNQQIEG